MSARAATPSARPGISPQGGRSARRTDTVPISTLELIERQLRFDLPTYGGDARQGRGGKPRGTTLTHPEKPASTAPSRPAQDPRSSPPSPLSWRRTQRASAPRMSAEEAAAGSARHGSPAPRGKGGWHCRKLCLLRPSGVRRVVLLPPCTGSGKGRSQEVSHDPCVTGNATFNTD